MFSLSLSVMLVGIAVAMDWAKLSSSRQMLRDIADGAVLAGAIHADANRADRVGEVKAYLEMYADELARLNMHGEPVIVFDDTTDRVSVTINARQPLMLGGLLGQAEKDVTGSSTANYATDNVDPISIAFALDVSGSMGNTTTDGQVKIEALKRAVPALFRAIERGAKNPQMVKNATRTSVATYNTALVDSYAMEDGWDHLRAKMTGLAAQGGTNSTPALAYAYDQLKTDRTRHEKDGQNLKNLREYVIFMTDGDNNQDVFDETTQDLCAQMKGDGVVIYSIAFAAPTKGELLLLDCASENTQPEEGVTGDANKCRNVGGEGIDGQGQCPVVSEDLTQLDHQDIADAEDAKSAHYYDAANAANIKKAFEDIGRKIASSTIRLM